jgi:hypothetical protein
MFFVLCTFPNPLRQHLIEGIEMKIFSSFLRFQGKSQISSRVHILGIVQLSITTKIKKAFRMFSFCVFASMSCKLVLLIIVLHVFLIVVESSVLKRKANWNKQNTQIALREKFADERNKQRVPFQAFSIFGIGPDLIFGVCFVHRGSDEGGTS